MNINDLTEQQLNTLAALGQGWGLIRSEEHEDFWNTHSVRSIPCRTYDPCNNWSQAGELVEKYRLFVGYQPNSKKWCAGTWFGNNDQLAHLPKLAIVRAFVASKYGTDIDYDTIVGGE